MLELDVYQPATHPSLYTNTSPPQNPTREEKFPWLPTKASSVSHPQASQHQILPALRPSHDHGIHDTIAATGQSTPREPTVHARAPEPQMSRLRPVAKRPLSRSPFPTAISRAQQSLALRVRKRCPGRLGARPLTGFALEISEQRIVSCFPPAPCAQALPIGQPFPRAFAATPALVWTRFPVDDSCCCYTAVDIRT
jgi:hypothetical protein